MSDENEILETDTKKKKSFNWVVICAIIAFAILLSFVILAINSSHDLAYKLNKQTTKQYKRIEKLNKEIEKHPDNYKLYLNRADAEYKKQKLLINTIAILATGASLGTIDLEPTEIIKDLKKAESLNPDLDLNLTKGIVYSESSFLEEDAIKCLTEYINKNNPTNYAPYYYRGKCYLSRYYLDDDVVEFRNNALSDLQKALSLNPRNIDIYLTLGDLYAIENFFKGNKDEECIQNAMNYYNKALHMTKYNSYIYVKMANLYTFDDEHYLPAIKKALSAKGNYNMSLYNSLAGVYRESNAIFPKIEMLNNVVSIGNYIIGITNKCQYCNLPEDFKDSFVKYNILWSYDSLAYSYFLTNNLKKADQCLQQCNKIAKDFSINTGYCDVAEYNHYIKLLNDRRIKNYTSSDSPSLKLLHIKEVKTSADKNPIMIVENISGEPINNVRITFNLYDAYDNIINETYALAKQIGTKGSYTFKAPVLDFDNRIVRWELDNIQIRGEE